MCAGVIIPSAMMSEDERKSTSPTAPSSFWHGLLLAFALGCVLKFVAIVSWRPANPLPRRGSCFHHPNMV